MPSNYVQPSGDEAQASPMMTPMPVVMWPQMFNSPQMVNGVSPAPSATTQTQGNPPLRRPKFDPHA